MPSVQARAETKAAPAAEKADGWDFCSRTLADDALAEFRAELKRETDPAKLRQIKLGMGIALTNAQPKTDDNLDKAVAAFTEVAAGGARDELAAMARYYIARVVERHRYAQDDAQAGEYSRKAATLYKELFADMPDQLFAQLGMVKYAMITIYDTNLPTADRPKVLADLETLLPKITHPLAARDFHSELGAAYLYLPEGVIADAKKKALEHYLEVDRYGLQRFTAKADLWIRIGNLARDEKRNDLALEYLGRFVAEYPRDSRNYYARKVMGELGRPSQVDLNDPASVARPAPSAAPAPAAETTPAPAAPAPSPSAQP
ncbi:hypothetical protein DB346_21515 [Verrucomicrobia bacterium LW23]|nr:hypothetical protein DB346_21515 [Verrucomicrobia bacterium LW23]